MFREEMFDKKREIFFERALWIKENADKYIEEEIEKERQERYYNMIDQLGKTVVLL